MRLSINPILKAFIKRAYIENYKRNFYNKSTFISSLLILIFIFSLLLLPKEYLHIPSNSTLYSKVLFETYGINLPPSEAAIVLSIIPVIIFLPAIFTQVLSSSIPFYFLYNLRINSEIEIFMSYLGGPNKVFSIIVKASLIFTLIYYIIYYGVSTILIALFIPILLTSIQFLILFYVGGFLIIIITLLLLIILNLKFPSLSKPSMAIGIGRSAQPSLVLSLLTSVLELIIFETISSVAVSSSQFITFIVIGLNLFIAITLIILFVKLSGSITAEDLISK
jgi:hypothetical protein